MKIAICGSMYFAKEMIEIKKKFEDIGHGVIVPENTEKYADKNVSENKNSKEVGSLIKNWYEKLKSMDAVLILNKTKNNIENYIGGSGLIEIAFAHVLGKKIFLLNNVPQMSYTGEILSMKPIILNGDLSKIN